MLNEQELEPLAERIATQGPDALVERLRAAFRQAAETHADIVTVDDERLEEMIQRSVESADGLQWRHALASVAVTELSIELPEALTHPAVARAQELVGAPSYEDSLAELTGRTPRPSRAAHPSRAEGRVDELEEVEALDEAEVPPMETETVTPLGPDGAIVREDGTVPAPEDVLGEEPLEEILAEDDATLAEKGAEDEAGVTEEGGGTVGEAERAVEEEPAADEEPDTLRVNAIHLGGVANLPAGRQGIDVRLSEAGLDILRSDDDIIGRLEWGDIEKLEVPAPRGRRRRRNARGVLVIRTEGGDASFEIPPMTPDELRDRVDPIVARFGQG